MLRQTVGTAAALWAAVTLMGAQAPPVAEGPTLIPRWSVTSGLASPESAYYDERSNAIFVSSINGQILDKDGNGYVSRLSVDGRVVADRWATGLHAPKGLRSVGGTLWAADIDAVVGIDIATGRVSARVAVAGAQFLNDLATAPDGTIYVSDSNTSQIFAVKDGASSVFVEGGDLVEQPNGLLVDGDRLILGTIGPAGGRRGGGQATGGHLFAFDRRTRARTQLTTQPVGGIDGIELDGRGGLIVTDVLGARLLHVTASGDVRVLAKFSAGGADFGYVAATRTAVVPFLFANSVSAYDLTAALR